MFVTNTLSFDSPKIQLLATKWKHIVKSYITDGYSWLDFSQRDTLEKQTHFSKISIGQILAARRRELYPLID